MGFTTGPPSLLEWILALADTLLDSLASMFDSADFDDFTWTPQSPAAAAMTEARDFKRETLNAHNNFRTMHGCPPLVLSEELTSTAQAWADKLADRGILQYSENPSLGENICVVDLETAASRKGEQVVREWYKEIDNYSYESPGWKRGAHHVSQLLWKSTSEIGVGISRAPGQHRAFVVVNYRPAGNNNTPGEFERNVLPPVVKTRSGNDNANLRTSSNRR